MGQRAGRSPNATPTDVKIGVARFHDFASKNSRTIPGKSAQYECLETL